ncbi:MAG TPA: hypothetical protein H9932_11925 [Candidatus Brachybacterium intestinipullorum]|uniref:RNA-binding protein n=1 Tax=Candidatus Brachybacterium intestinipullorum TaxID=2838512 RepID=A0A9D2TIT5_9MICO|nr:hypothetical protein [Candidatus Brachybacterium intestinipullorum]
MALIHPHSLERWQEWRDTRRPAAALRGAASRLLRRPDPAQAAAPGFTLHTREGTGTSRVLLGIDAAGPTGQESLLAVLPYLHGTVEVLTPADLDLSLPGDADWTHHPVIEPRAALAGRGITAVLTTGWEHPVGREVHAWAMHADVPNAVLQDGTVTPFSAPLPPRTTLLAWTEADGEFRRSGRREIEVRAVGSQRLWEASHGDPVEDVDPEATPLFLGELAAVELPRRLAASAAHSFCRSTGARYQPGPADGDRLSRATHSLLRRRGITVQDPPLAPSEFRGPVVSIMSADLLEAAVRGLPAWVHCPHAPDWLHEYWERYGLRPHGAPATAAPPIGADEPARLIAQILEGDA